MRRFLLFFCSLCMLSVVHLVCAQDIHFSQYYNTPMLQNAANTGLMSDRDFRISSIYRNQWSSIPAPFRTFAFAGEFQTLRNNQFTNWLGLGFYGLSDKAGDGDLSMTAYGMNVAYHLMLNESSALSVGLGASYNNRAIDFAKLTFDAQWDGFSFNRSLPNGEIRSREKATYNNVVTGINYSYFPNENIYFKIGVGMSHVNRPKVSLLDGNENRLGFRPMLTTDAIILLDRGWKVTPSAYFTFMQKATNAIIGASIAKDFHGAGSDMTGYFYTGVYYRYNESVIALVGIEWSDVKLTMTYDITTSQLAPYNNSNGAFEVSLVFQGLYGKSGVSGKTPWECPRF